MITVAYIGFGVSVREYHIPYVENREDIRVKYVYRRAEDIAQFAEYEPFYPEIIFTTDLDLVLGDPDSIWWSSTPRTGSMCPTPSRS